MPYRVLVVEDEPLVRMLAVDVVEEAGFEAVEASNADEALELLESMPDIRLIFTDIDMPGSMDGLRLAATVRDRWPPVRIIVVSGKQRPSAAELPDGIFFPKPYDVGKVCRTMQGMLAA
ncbi:response regulator [Neorhizobium alkalisoli]|uniref:Response regulator receiver domain-containing protein n=1 Tax=Neorhizobium alkalisoli TaxID=528178 RepID=A0A561QGL0_9HYPH|nr:response regulator [Neorhizobium alkalisoli]TWF49510.1 response regulator receiver domain-containing protein [Neorhizobium alkalisoli]